MEITGVTYSVSDYKYYEETRDKNIFEEIVDKMILDEVAGMNESFKRAISSLPKRDKRMAILSILDKDRNLFKRIKALSDQNINKMEHIKDIILMLREYVKVGEVEKKKFGEVMTPLELVKEMLATLPEEVWSNPDLKWLDPANGTGPYPIMVIYKLMNGLKNCPGLEDDEIRYKHIVENMIYVCELQPKNQFLYMCAVDPFDTYDLNVYTGSFLDEGFDKHMKEVWGVDKFDVCMSNPPYQKKNDGDRKPFSLWDKFVFKSFNMLSEKGYLVKVHPNGWRNIDGDFKYIQNLIKDKILYINMNSVQDGERVFGASTSFDFYLVSKDKDKSILTKIKDFDNKIEYVDITKFNLIPNSDISLVYSFIANDTEPKIKILYSRSKYGTDKSHMSRVQTKLNKYPCVYSILKNGDINLFYSNKKEDFFEPKVIFGNGANPTYIFDRSGDFGLTQFSFGVVGDLECIEKALIEKRQIIDRITRATKFISTNGNPVLYPKILSIFRNDFFEKINSMEI